MNVVICKALPNESQKLFAIYQQEGSKDLEILKNIFIKEFKEIGTKRIIWFAEIDNKVIGAIQLIFIANDNPLLDSKTTVMLHHLRVTKEFEGKGIASLLYHKLEQEAQKLNFSRIILEVEKDNNNAQEIYTHWGYTFLQEGRISTEIIMCKKLA